MVMYETRKQNVIRLWSLLGPFIQFGMALFSTFFTNFSDLKVKYDLPTRLYLEPAPTAFFIWNLIFVGFIVLGIYQFSAKRAQDPKWIKARPFIIISTLGNSIWLLADIFANTTVCLMAFVIILYSLIRLYGVLEIADMDFSLRERFVVKYPVSLYFGWITFAFPIGVTLWLMSVFHISGTELGNPVLWSAVVVVIALLIFLGLYLNDKVSTSYVVVGIWGLFWLFLNTRSNASLLSYYGPGITCHTTICNCVEKNLWNQKKIEGEKPMGE